MKIMTYTHRKRTLWSELKCDRASLFVLTVTGLFYLVATGLFVGLIFGGVAIGFAFGG